MNEQTIQLFRMKIVLSIKSVEIGNIERVESSRPFHIATIQLMNFCEKCSASTRDLVLQTPGECFLSFRCWSVGRLVAYRLSRHFIIHLIAVAFQIINKLCSHSIYSSNPKLRCLLSGAPTHWNMPKTKNKKTNCSCWLNILTFFCASSIPHKIELLAIHSWYIMSHAQLNDS